MNSMTPSDRPKFIKALWNILPANAPQSIPKAADNTLKVWDVDCRQCLATMTHLPNNQWVAQTTGQQMPTAMSKTANEHLIWVGHEKDSGQFVAIPYEGFLNSSDE